MTNSDKIRLIAEKYEKDIEIKYNYEEDVFMFENYYNNSIEELLYEISNDIYNIIYDEIDDLNNPFMSLSELEDFKNTLYYTVKSMSLKELPKMNTPNINAFIKDLCISTCEYIKALADDEMERKLDAKRENDE